MENFGYSSEELVPIVAELAPKYAGCEHSSITYEKAQMLMEGVLYCIRECMESGRHGLLSNELPAKEAYTLGQELVIQKVQNLQTLSNRLMFEFHDYGPQCLKDVVMKGFPAFLANYDFKYAPQETLLTLDYPILKDISALSGIDAVLAYAECIMLEQEFLTKFDNLYVTQILSAYHTDYELLMENICQIVLANLMGHIIVDKPLSAKGFDTEDLKNIAENLTGKSTEETEHYMTNILVLLTKRYYNGDERLKDYLCCTIPDIAARVCFGMENHCLQGVFLI